jgi:hypothetical protein
MRLKDEVIYSTKFTLNEEEVSKDIKVNLEVNEKGELIYEGYFVEDDKLKFNGKTNSPYDVYNFMYKGVNNIADSDARSVYVKKYSKESKIRIKQFNCIDNKLQIEYNTYYEGDYKTSESKTFTYDTDGLGFYVINAYTYNYRDKNYYYMTLGGFKNFEEKVLTFEIKEEELFKLIKRELSLPYFISKNKKDVSHLMGNDFLTFNFNGDIFLTLKEWDGNNVLKLKIEENEILDYTIRDENGDWELNYKSSKLKELVSVIRCDFNYKDNFNMKEFESRESLKDEIIKLESKVKYLENNIDNIIKEKISSLIK